MTSVFHTDRGSRNMEKASTNDDVLAHSILCKPFRNASATAQEVRNIVVCSITNGYQDTAPRSERKEPWWQGALAAWGFLGVIASVAVAAVGSLFAVPVMLS